MIQKILTDIGFTQNEASLYLASLELGLAPASSIARKAGKNRVTAYGILQDLEKKGYATSKKKGNATYFLVISPEDLLKKHQQQTSTLEQALPEFIGLMNTVGSKPKMFWYTDLQGLKDVYNNILHSLENFSVFLGTKDIHPDFHHFLEHDFLPRRIKSPITCRAIVSKSDSFYANFNRETHDALVIDSPIFDIANEIIIYDHDKVAICLFSSQELSATVVQSKTFHDCMLGIFDLIFKKRI